MDNDKCFFWWKYSCCDKDEKLITIGQQRIRTIISCSEVYGDRKETELQNRLAEDQDLKFKCHKSCVSKYTDKNKVTRYETRKRSCEEVGEKQQPKVRRSVTSSFNFRQHCIYCGEDCVVEKDKKHPDRWRPAYIIREKIVSQKKSIKELILDTCNKRNDEWSSHVRIRVEGAVSDLHAADGRYHVNCRNAFLGELAVSAAKQACNEATKQNGNDKYFQEVVDSLKADESRIWNSLELFKLYKDRGGTTLSRRQLIKALTDTFQSQLVVMSSNGYASVLIFRKKANDVLRLTPDDDSEYLSESLSFISKQIRKEIKDIKVDKNNYTTQLSFECIYEETSQTLMKLLASLNPKLDKTPPALLIGNIVTATILNAATSLQVAMGAKVRFSKELTQCLHNFQIVCSYDEILRFKKSAALAAVKAVTCSGMTNLQNTFTQVIVDNFDADISSQNGKLSTHSLAMVVAQTQDISVNNEFICSTNSGKIPRVKKSEMAKEISYCPEIAQYHGPSKPSMPAVVTVRHCMPLKLLCQRLISVNEAKSKDFNFLKDILFKELCPEYHGYNTQACREKKLDMKPATSGNYQPLIDMNPSHPDTMMTAMIEAQRLTKKAGQDFTVFTCDQQLYRVALKLTWAYPDQFADVFLRLGGMHMLMSFIGCVGTLMAESGLSEMMSDVFAGVANMLKGKKFPQNIRALRMVTEELLRGVFEDHQPTSNTDLMLFLEEISLQSKTCKLWVDCLIKPVFLMMLYVRAEREGNWLLHIEAVKGMLPYFFAAGHHNYARYGLFYLRTTENISSSMLDNFLNGNHVMRHMPGYWNGIWSDMWIETTFMRFGHGLKGIIGITLKPEAVKTWALSLHICTKLEEDVVSFSQEEYKHHQKMQNKHKEEMRPRIEADAKDREGIRLKLQGFIDPLKPDKHPENLVNIATGRVFSDEINVYDAVKIGRNQMNEFENGWPEYFYERIPQQVKTMSATKKSILVDTAKVCDTEIIYSRIIGLQASSRGINVEKVLSHELSPIPTSLFDDFGEMRLCKAKSKLKTLLMEDLSSRTLTMNGTVLIIDGSAMLWVIPWPDHGSVRDYITRFKTALIQKLKIGDVHLIFDRYHLFSTKDVTRHKRVAGVSRVHHLSMSSPLPSQKVILTVTENKKQLISLICCDIMNNKELLEPYTLTSKLVVTGPEEVPFEVSGISVSRRNDLATLHEEADVIIVQQAVKLGMTTGTEQVIVISEDTDVFLLLLYYYSQQKITIPMFMDSPIQGRSVIDIGRSVERHYDIIPDILAGHALSGCDTTASLYGIGKTKIVNTLRKGYSLSLMGKTEESINDVNKQATTFINICYGFPKCSTISEARVKSWSTKMGSSHSAQPPKLCSLPPTNEAFLENVKRAHLQTCIWKNALGAPPSLCPEKFGYYKDNVTKLLLPVTVPANVALAPSELLKLIKCTCESEMPCRTMRCGCMNSGLPCTMFCHSTNDTCLNSNNKVLTNCEDGEEDEEQEIL